MNIIYDQRFNCCCPICGYEFWYEEIQEYNNICELGHGPYNQEELIGNYDDYEWVY